MIRASTPTKPAPSYPFNWPASKPSRESRKPKRKWKRKADGLTSLSLRSTLSLPSQKTKVGPFTPGKTPRRKRAIHPRFFCACRKRTSARMPFYGGDAGQASAWPVSLGSGSEQPRVRRLHPDCSPAETVSNLPKESVMSRKDTRAQGAPTEATRTVIPFPRSKKRGRKAGPKPNAAGASIVALKPRPCAASARPLTAEDVQDLAVARELLQRISSKLWRDARDTEASELAHVADLAVRDLWFAAYHVLGGAQ
jgi:hypothetical protein